MKPKAPKRLKRPYVFMLVAISQDRKIAPPALPLHRLWESNIDATTEDDPDK